MAVADGSRQRSDEQFKWQNLRSYFGFMFITIVHSIFEGLERTARPFKVRGLFSSRSHACPLAAISFQITKLS